MKKLFYSLFLVAMTAMTLTSCEDVPAPFDIPNTSSDTPGEAAEPKGSGTQDDPYNVAAAIEYTEQLAAGAESDRDIFIKGKISSIRESYTSQYGNGSFYISDDGTSGHQFLIYRALYLGNKKYSEGQTQIEVGDEVIICGRVTNYNGTLETQQNKAFLYSLNGVTAGGGGGGQTGTPTGDGTLANPYNAAGANAYTSGLAADVESDKDIYIKGKIAKIANNGEFSASYGNASFYISDDGTESGSTFYVFRTYYLNNKKWTSGDSQIKVGDEVVICGRVVNYRGNTPETVQNKSYIYSLNGSGGGGDTPQPGEGTGSGTLADPWNSVAANAYTSSLPADTESDKEYYIKGKVAKIANNGTFSAQYGNASFYISDDGTDNNTFYVFRTLYCGNRQWVDGDAQIKVGDEVIICGRVVNYKGNTPETVQNKSYIYSLNGSTTGEGGGGGGGGEQTGAGSYSEPYSVSAAIAKAEATGVYVKGYIVGYVEGQVYTEGAHFSATGDNVSTTNVLLAGSPSETSAANCIPVQLPKGEIRDKLNLSQNAGNLGKEVLLYGDITKYFSVPGFKNTSYAEINGTTIGTKP